MTTSGQRVGMIWAQTPDGIIGRDGDMPWRAPADMAHFKATTMGHPVVMGRRTWASIPPRFRPFEGRTTIVLTSDAATVTEVKTAGALVATSLDDALAAAAAAPGGELVWIVGGGAVYASAADRADLAVVTVLELDVADGDTSAPVLGSDFVLTHAEPPTGYTAAERGPNYRFETWTRRTD